MKLRHGNLHIILQRFWNRSHDYFLNKDVTKNSRVHPLLYRLHNGMFWTIAENPGNWHVVFAHLCQKNGTISQWLMRITLYKYWKAITCNAVAWVSIMLIKVCQSRRSCFIVRPRFRQVLARTKHCTQIKTISTCTDTDVTATRNT